MEQLPLRVWDKLNGLELDATVFLNERNCFLLIRICDDREWQANEKDYSNSLAEIRKEMEVLDLYPLCNGCCQDVVLSRMGRQMSAGRKAYKVTLGKQALMSDLVDIFEPAPKERVSTLNEQQEYYKKWTESL